MLSTGRTSLFRKNRWCSKYTEPKVIASQLDERRTLLSGAITFPALIIQRLGISAGIFVAGRIVHNAHIKRDAEYYNAIRFTGSVVCMCVVLLEHAGMSAVSTWRNMAQQLQSNGNYVSCYYQRYISIFPTLEKMFCSNLGRFLKITIKTYRCVL